MSRRTATLLALTLAACAKSEPPTPPVPAVSRSILATVGDAASTIEGIASYDGKLYVCDWKDGTIYRIDPASPAPVAVGGLPLPPGTAVLGMITDAEGNLYLAVPDPGVVYRVKRDRLGAANFDRQQDAVPFATKVEGANGLAFDPGARHLWIAGGPTGNVYQVGPQGGEAAVAGSGFATMSTDTTVPVRVYLVNGMAFDRQGMLYTLNTGTGEVTQLSIDSSFTVAQVNPFVRDSRLIGADGLDIDAEGNLWLTANYRNTLARIGPDRTVTIVAASTPTGTFTDSTMVPAYPQEGATNALRFPAEFELLGRTAYLANLNFPIGANSGQPVKGASVAAVVLP